MKVNTYLIANELKRTVPIVKLAYELAEGLASAYSVEIDTDRNELWVKQIHLDHCKLYSELWRVFDEKGISFDVCRIWYETIVGRNGNPIQVSMMHITVQDDWTKNRMITKFGNYGT